MAGGGRFVIRASGVHGLCEPGVQCQGGVRATTKENDKEHGYGLQNVREIVLKYQGEMNYEVREGRFVVEVLI